MVDMAHYAGLIAGGEYPNPVPHADVVTSTTHKSLRGPRSGFILMKSQHEKAINSAVFPGQQGGPLMHVIAAKAVAMKIAGTEEFRERQERTVRGAAIIAERLGADDVKAAGVSLVTGGTDNHLLLVDLRPFGLTGDVAEKALDEAGLTSLRADVMTIGDVHSVEPVSMLPGARRRLYLDALLASLADPVLGPWFGPLLYLAVFASSVASLQTTFLPAARAMLAMGAYKAFPSRFAEVSPRFLTPVYSTVVAGVVTGGFYTVVKLLSDNALWDTIAALGIMICWYYGITAFACVWFFRRELFDNAHNIIFKFLFPLLGGLMLAVVFVIAIGESMNPENGSGAEIGGIGLVFFIGFGILALGAVLMLVMRARRPEFFLGQTLRRDTPALVE